jgi:hypothetical protein
MSKAPSAGGAVPMPASADDLTAEWFTRALADGGIAGEVRRVELRPVGVGVGMMGCLFQVRLHYDAGEGPASVVVKLPTASEQNRQVAVAFDNYAREVAFYRLAAHRTPMRTAKLYFGAVDGSADFVLVLEDLSDWGQGDQVIGADLQQAERCMTALAELHAAFWNRVDDGDLEWMPNAYPSVMSDGLLQGTTAMYGAFNRNFAADVPTALQRLEDRYVDALPQVQAWISSPPRTIVHGDFRMDNLFFGRNASQSPVACCDWQGSVRGNGIPDIAYFLSGSVATSVRRRHEKALIGRWLAALQDGGVEGYGFDDAWEDYRRAVLMLWSYVVVIGGGLDASNERGNRWVAAMVQRSCAAMDDLGCLDLVDQFASR